MNEQEKQQLVAEVRTFRALLVVVGSECRSIWYSGEHIEGATQSLHREIL